jgi:hypothetical protein
LGVATLSIATMGLFLPQAAAQSAPNLAPGLDCEGLQCTNNSNNTYAVDYDAVCLEPEADKPTSVAQGVDTIPPHQRTHLSKTCMAHYAGKDHHHLVNGDLVDAYFKGATVITPPRPGTGSAG